MDRLLAAPRRTFVNNSILPVNPFEKLFVLDNVLIRREQNVELSSFNVVFENVFANNLGPLVTNGPSCWAPLSKLVLPIRQGR